MMHLEAIKDQNAKPGVGKKLSKLNGKPQKKRVLKRRKV